MKNARKEGGGGEHQHASSAAGWALRFFHPYQSQMRCGGLDPSRLALSLRLHQGSAPCRLLVAVGGRCASMAGTVGVVHASVSDGSRGARLRNACCCCCCWLLISFQQGRRSRALGRALIEGTRACQRRAFAFVGVLAGSLDFCIRWWSVDHHPRKAGRQAVICACVCASIDALFWLTADTTRHQSQPPSKTQGLEEGGRSSRIGIGRAAVSNLDTRE